MIAAGRDNKLQPLFTDDAIMPIWQETRGYPRSICLLSLHLTLELLSTDYFQIDGPFVEQFLANQSGYRQAE